ncbi:MAG: hypothetical protein K9L24_02295, partial [Spirochaetia bacterium]|nr:hypothetical protein [Spirochaetia bacterium]
MKREIEITNGNTIKKALTITLEDSFFSNRHFLADVYSPCTNPLCTCGELGFLIFEQSDNSNKSDQAPVFR